jgi:uncharacterized protein (TIGR03067 family)
VAVTPEPQTEAQEFREDLRPLLDRELSRLPDKYRAAIVLCDLEGVSRKDAALRLGCPEGSVSSRLARGRAMLASRLSRKGLAVSGRSLAAALSQGTASACVQASLAASTARAASLFASGQTAGAGLISCHAAALTDGVLKAMWVKSVKAVAEAVLALGVVAGVGGLLSHRLLMARQGTAGGPPAEGKKGAAKGEGKRTPKDDEAIRGTWSLVNLEQVNHKPSDAEKAAWKAGKIKVKITADRIDFLTDKSEAGYKLDPSKEPKQIEWVVEEKSVPGIYSLRGDELKMCIGRAGDKAPPSSFDIKKAAPGTFPTCWTFKRDKAGNPNP